MKSRRLLSITALCLLIGACASQQPLSSQVLIQGAWQAEFEGQAMTLVYSVSDVTVREFGISFPYEWVDDDHIQLNAMGQQVVSRVEFETPDLMRQITDGDVQLLQRVQ